MKLNWFSPLSPARTDIAHYTTRILPALQERAQVTLWTDLATWDPNLEHYAMVRHYRPDQMPWAELNGADMTFYNIGNHAGFHMAIWEISQRHPGIAILHDVRLQELFAHFYRARRGDRQGYLRQMETYYGPQGYADADLWWTNKLAMPYLVERYPLTGLGAAAATGILVHTADAAEMVRKESSGPLAYLPLPYPATGAAATRPAGPPYRLIVFGYIHLNRRLDAILSALAALEPSERAQFRLDIYGELWDTDYVRSEICALGLDESVTIHGFVSDTALDAALASSHLALNLRYPSMGEASGSQLRLWNQALPSLVTPVGVYAAMPEEAVAFVRPDYEVADIHKHLCALLANPARFERMGRAGRRILERRHSPEAYADAIVSLARQGRDLRARSVAYNLAERVAMEAGPWVGAPDAAGLFRTAATAIQAIVTPIESAAPSRTRVAGVLPDAAYQARLSLLDARTTLRAGARTLTAVRVRNDSAYVWPALGSNGTHRQIKLGNHWRDGHGSLIVADDGRAALPHDLQPGESVEIALPIAAPAEPGAYILELDMVQEDERWFADLGSPTARVDVSVAAYDPGIVPTLTALTVPLGEAACQAEITLLDLHATILPGALALVHVRVKNLSDATWPALGAADGMYQIQLGNHWLDDGGQMSVQDDGRAVLPKDLKPGDAVEIPLAIKAPAEHGVYVLELDMMQQGVRWFTQAGSRTEQVRVRISDQAAVEQTAPLTRLAPPSRSAATGPLPDGAYRAQVTWTHPPASVAAGSHTVVDVTVGNVGDVPWPAQGLAEKLYQLHLGCRWLDEQGRVVADDSERTPLPHDVKPLQDVAVPLVIVAPRQPGSYILELDMVQEGVAWFRDRGSETDRVHVVVTPA